MQASLLALSALSALPLASAAETVLGAYIFHRHGDRTAKAWPPANLTALGADEAFSSGDFYRARYVSGSAPLRIAGLSPDQAVVPQLAVSAPVDTVLHDSAVAFMQGVYPPISRASETLANGTRVEAPLGGYQYIPVNAVAAAASSPDAENSEWLQADSGCPNAVVSSNNYLKSSEYTADFSRSEDFYHGLLPVIGDTFSSEDANFKNAYAIYDLVNVATIHNSSIPSAKLLTKPTLQRLYDLGSLSEWNLAYNSSDPVRAIDGSVLAGQVLDALDAIVTKTKPSPLLNVQFGSYNVFMSFFGLAGLQRVSDDFTGVCDYASSMAFELVTSEPAATFKPDDVSVRFYFANGTAAENPLREFPLFGSKKTTLPWADFKASMQKFAIRDTQHWCDLCGNTEGQCASNSTSSSSGGDGSSSSSSSHSSGGVSKAVAGVIGALVTLVVVLGLEALIMLAAGLRLVKKSTLARAGSQESAPGGVKAS